MFFFTLLCAVSVAEIINEKVVRDFDLKGNIFFARYTVTFKPTEKDVAKGKYLFPMEFDPEHLSTIAFTIDSQTVSYEFDEEAREYHVEFPQSLKEDESHTLVAKALLFDIAYPKPKQLTQSEIQCVQLDGNLQFPSKYHTTSDDVYIHVHTNKYLSASPQITFDLKAEIFYYHSSNVKPGNVEPFYVHIACPSNFLTLTKYDKEVIVSLIAPTRVKEVHTLRNSGSELHGELNGYKNLVQRNDEAGVVRQVQLHLPPTANEISYRDEIGNISTSAVATSPAFTRLTIEPRFPLWGGWKINFDIQYFLPTDSIQVPATAAPSKSPRAFFFSDDEEEQKTRTLSGARGHSVAVPIAASMQHAHVQESVVRVALPEGAVNVAAFSSVEGLQKDEKDGVTYYTMDYLGRRTLIFRRKNVLNCPAFGDINIVYDIPTYYRIHKPLILGGIILCVVLSLRFLSSFSHWFRKGTIDTPLPASAYASAAKSKEE